MVRAPVCGWKEPREGGGAVQGLIPAGLGSWGLIGAQVWVLGLFLGGR